MNYIKILKFLRSFDKDLFEVSSKQQEGFLKKMKVPKDDIDRSYNQFRGRHFFYHTFKEIAAEIVSFFALPIYIIYCIILYIFKPKPKNLIQAVGDFNSFEEVIPNSLRQEFDIDNNVWNKGRMLSGQDVLLLCKIFFRHPVPCFVFKIAIKLSYYKYMIYCYSPNAIIVHNEASYAGSILTKYCNDLGIEHINVQHGEKLFYIGNAYFRYNRCYVWGEHYKQMFLNLQAEPNQFRIEIPESFNIDVNKHFRKEYYSDYKYYLQVYDEPKLLSIIKSLNFILKNNKTYKFRPHPRFSNIKLLESLVDKSQIEYPRDVPILESIASTKHAIGSFTTVLNQAFYANIDVIFDDVTYKDTFYKLGDLNYIFANANTNKLSDYVEK